MAPIMKFSLLFTLFNLSLLATAQGTGTQFITGPCTSDAACGSGCCGFNTGKCAGAIVALERDGGCGFGNAVPNDNAARILRGQAPAAAPAPPANNGNNGNRNGNGNGNGNANNGNNGNGNNGNGNGAAAGSGKPLGTQFITGVCASDAECASGCCGFNSGKCAAAIVAQERDGGCGFGDGVPNDRAAQALRGNTLRFKA